ncbi:MAG: radical SAM protein [Elusimicrobia bacterium]|nr:radical SAM protein [Elusimicrobiota bacterium]
MAAPASPDAGAAYGPSELSRLRAKGLATNKEIRRFKVAINTACPLRCEYCFIDKDSGEVISWDHVAGLVRFLLSSPGPVKKLLLYGGEPFLNFPLVKEIALYARAEAVKAGKDLDLSICTSAALPLKREWLQFLSDQRFFLSVSMDGDEATHDAHRRDKKNKGSWRKMIPNLPLVFDTIGKRRSMAIQCVHPDNVGKMLDNYKTLVGLGFENIEIEVIHGFGWKEKKHLFRPMMQKVLDHVWAEAQEGRFLSVVCSLVPLMLKDGIVREDWCPFHSSMETYPDGNFSFYPFAFVDWEGRKRSKVGDVEAGVPERYRACTFDLATETCKNCTSDYYRNPSVNEGNDPYRWRTEMARAFMDRVALAARTEPAMKAYLKEALIRCRIS